LAAYQEKERKKKEKEKEEPNCILALMGGQLWDLGSRTGKRN
jgi:hypothetical protein